MEKFELFRRQQSKKKDKTLWTEYPDYNPINNIDERPLFDESKVSDEHRVLGQIIRENWNLIHPLAKDYILSAASEWRKLNIGSDMDSTDNMDQLMTAMEDEYGKKAQRIILEKDAEIAKVKEEVAESFRMRLEEKNKEIEQYKMLAESVKTSIDEKQISHSNFQSEFDEREKRIAVLEKLVEDLRDQCKSQEIEAMNVQTGISKNFQIQISEMTNELYERQEQIEKLRTVLSKAKNQLVSLKEKNGELILKNQQLEKRIENLDKEIAEKENKLRQVVKTIENIE